MKALFEVEFKTDKDAKNAALSIEQETEFKRRVASKVSSKGDRLLVEMDADDVVALRAAMNSYFRLIYVIKGIDSRKED